MNQKFIHKHIRSMKKYTETMKKVIVWSVIGLLFMSIAVYKVQYDRQMILQKQLADKILRFHVLANSNSAEDQMLKLQVRDAIGGYIQENLPADVDKWESKRIITAHLESIESIAEEIITKEGYAYHVTASVKECDFPVKTYGAYTFPAGTYEAVQVVIGEGEGENWWCVLYPNMCFENSIYEVVDENAKNALREVLDKEEYEAVLNAGKYEIRFRFLEWFR